MYSRYYVNSSGQNGTKMNIVLQPNVDFWCNLVLVNICFSFDYASLYTYNDMEAE